MNTLFFLTGKTALNSRKIESRFAWLDHACGFFAKETSKSSGIYVAGSSAFWPG
jgi:hypothetical protein